MNSELKNIVLELRTLNQQFHWSDIANLTDDLLDNKQAQKYLLLVARGVNTIAFKAWMNQILGAEVSEVQLETFIKEPTPAITASKVVVMLECGNFLNADAVNILNTAVLSRPLASYAIVFSSAERITNEEELSLIERGARRLFTPTANVKVSQKLVEQQIFLWSEESDNNHFLSNRLATDLQALGTWLTEPLSGNHEFEIYQVLSLINLAEEYFHNTKTHQASGIDDSVNQLTKTKEELAGCRRKLVNWLESDLTILESQLTTSLQTQKQNLLQGIGAYLQKHEEQLSPSLVTEYIEGNINTWKQQSQALLASRCQQIISDANNVLSEVNWRVVNEITKQDQQETVNPDSLLQLLEKAINSYVQNIFVKGGTVLPSVGDSSQNIFYAAGGAASGALIASLAERFLLSALGLPPFLPVVGAAAGVTIVGLTINRHQKTELLRKYTVASLTAIQEVISHVESEVIAQNQKINEVYHQILSRLQAIEEIMARRIHEVSQPKPQQNLISASENKFSELRQRVMEIKIVGN